MINPLFSRHKTLGLRLLFYVLLSLLLLALDTRFNYGSVVRRILLTAVSPIQYVVDFPSRTYQWLGVSISSQKALVNENTALRYREALLSSKLQRLIELKTENKKLRRLLQSGPIKEDNRFLVSELLAVKTSSYRQLLILDKGKEDGVRIGQAVLDAKGVMGQIIEVGPLTSTVMLVTDSKSAVPVKNTRNNERAILVGIQKGTTMALINLPKTVSIKAGDQLLTSGLGQRFPEGYPIGEVTAVHRAPDEAFISVEVRPNALVGRSRLMLIVLPNKTQRRLTSELKNRYQLPVGSM
jgi:rod shape-determining protein MreC